MSFREGIRQARMRLVAAGIPPEEAGLDAELLARHVLGCDRATLLARGRDEPPGEFAAAYETVIARRVRREPVAYILGHQEFWGRDFLVGPGVLIPRPESELLIEEALDYARDREGLPLCIVDVGTGSGCLAITLALELPDATVHATDISTDALAIARQNASRLGARVSFHHGSMLAGMLAPVDVIVCNPPYITRHDYERPQPEVRDHEPLAALVGGDDGRDDLRMQAYLTQRFGAMQPTDDDIARYYRDHPGDFTRGGELLPLADVLEEARQQLASERRSQLIAAWIADLRRRTDINVLYLPGPPGVRR